MNIQVGDIFGSKKNAYNERLLKEIQIVNSSFLRLPRKLKKRLKKTPTGTEVRITNIFNSGGMHTLTMKPI